MSQNVIQCHFLFGRNSGDLDTCGTAVQATAAASRCFVSRKPSSSPSVTSWSSPVKMAIHHNNILANPHFRKVSDAIAAELEN